MPSEVIARINQLASGDCYNVDEDIANSEYNDVDESDLNFTDHINQDDLQLTYNSTDSPVCDNQLQNNNPEPVEVEIDENERAVNDFAYNQGNDLFDENENIINDLSLEDDESLVFTAQEDAANDNTSEMDEKYGMRTSSYDLRPRHPRDYSHLFATTNHYIMSQYSLKKGIQMFGEKGVDAVMSELKQLHDRRVIEPIYPSDITITEQKKALPYLMFLKKKRSGQIKGRGCADGRRQRLDIPNEEASSPTVTLESVFLTSLIDAAEDRDVATYTWSFPTS